MTTVLLHVSRPAAFFISEPRFHQESWSRVHIFGDRQITQHAEVLTGELGLRKESRESVIELCVLVSFNPSYTL